MSRGPGSAWPCVPYVTKRNFGQTLWLGQRKIIQEILWVPMLCLINGESISSLHSVILQDKCEHTYIGIFTTSTNAICINQPHTSLINPAIINLNSLSLFSVTQRICICFFIRVCIYFFICSCMCPTVCSLISLSLIAGSQDAINWVFSTKTVVIRQQSRAPQNLQIIRAYE